MRVATRFGLSTNQIALIWWPHPNQTTSYLKWRTYLRLLMFDYLYPWSSEEKVWKCIDFDFVKWPVKVFTLFPFQTDEGCKQWRILEVYYIYIIYVNKRYVSMAMHWTLWMHVFVFCKMLQRAILGFHMQASKCCFRCPVMIVFPWHCFTVSSWWMMLFNMITIVQLLIMWRNVSPKIRLTHQGNKLKHRHLNLAMFFRLLGCIFNGKVPIFPGKHQK